MSGPSFRNAVNAKCRECGGQEGGVRFWRLHVSACPITDCALWKLRPLASGVVPQWLASRDPLGLPDDFARWTIEEAIAAIRAEKSVMMAKTGNISAATGNQVGEAKEHG